MKVFWRTFLKRRDKDEDRFPFGMRFYDGPMGAGKSLTMVWDAIQLKDEFPDMRLISNIIIKDFPDQKNFDTVEELIALLEESQDNKHTLVIIDEALTYFAENGGIDPALMNKITQSRACRRMIFIGSQKFKRLNNRLRDFSLETVLVKHIGPFQVNIVRDDTTLHWDKQEMDFIGDRKYTYIFKRHNDLYNRYDTFASVRLNTKLSTSSLAPAASPPPAAERGWGEMINKIWKEKKR